MAIIEELTFDLVDDICLGIQDGVLTALQIPSFCASSLGPVFELAEVLSGLSLSQIWLGAYQRILHARVQNRPSWFHEHGNQGFSKVQRLIDDPLAWNDLSIRVSHAAQKSGFPKDYAWKLIAAIGEIYGNVIEHSERVDSGYIAYSTHENIFEFVVCDGGIGVLHSLRKNPAYAEITDSGTALEYALAEGVSSLEESGHGFGFQPLLVGLANISNRVRFRSGNYGRELQRRSDGTIPARTVQLARMKGLFCSVSCTATA